MRSWARVTHFVAIIAFLTFVAIPAYAVGPSISSLSLTSGAVGASVTIAGSGFGSTQGTSTVKFNSTTVTSITSWSSASIVVTVPSGATTGNVTVTVSGRTSNGVAFTVLPSPAITQLSPSSGAVGSSVTISGSHFGTSQGQGQVLFYQAPFYSTITSWSDTSIVAVVPSGATTGNVYVYLSPGASSNGVPFTVYPSISSIFPGAGPTGSSVTITGVNFGSTQGSSSVSFGGVNANITSWSSTSIVTTVPAGAPSGNIVVTVNGQSSNGSYFQVGVLTNGVYHLHKEAGSTPGSDLLSRSGLDAASVSIQSTDLKGTTQADVKTFTTLTAIPGYIPASSTVTFSLWMQETAAVSSIYPYVVLNYAGTNLCGLWGTSPLTTTLTKMQFTCNLGNAVTLGTNGTLYLDVEGISLNGPVNKSVKVSLSLEGTAGGNYDSQITLPEVLYPFVSNISPPSGSAGTYVTISGGGFGATQGSSAVTFNGAVATPTSWSDTSITVPVPANASTGSVVVTVSGQATNAVNFSVPTTISGVSPAAGSIGTPITISGSGFGSSQGTSTVSFNGIPGLPTSWSSGSIVAPIPVGATSGPISVTVSGIVTTGPTVTVTPSITAVSPSVGALGSSVQIRGYNFGSPQGASTITFNGVPAIPGSWLDNSIVATVPSGATSGPLLVTVNGYSSNQFNFTLAPTINSISPQTGSAGTSVTVSGVNFGSSQGVSKVLFNGTVAIPSSWSDTTIVVPAPSGVSTGPITVIANNTSSNGMSFSVAPTIASVTPTSGTAGATVTIAGSNFGPTQGTSSIQFAGAVAAPTSWSSSKIVTAVPVGATSGQVVVTVANLQSNGVPFTIGNGALNGVVTQASDGTAISGASIQVFQAKSSVATSTTAADGSYSISNLPGGTYDVLASATGFGSTLKVGSAVIANSTVTANFSLSSPGTISGSVTKADGVTAISGATVTVSQGGDTVSTATSDSSGNYSVASLGAGTYDAIASDPGYSSQTRTGLIVTSGVVTSANFSLPGQSVITYAYDAGGRLVGVSDSQSDTATYQYDAVGNLLSITRNPSSQASIIELSPTSGPVGTNVTISGTGFSTTSSQNAVSFNGIAAVVTSANATQVVATVPSGATTGAVSVTAPSGTATSAISFTVTIGNGGPTITNFSPVSGIAGTPVTITGTGFDSTPSGDVVRFNLSPSYTSSATGTSLTTTAPSSTASGHISVQTRNGKATSTQDFYVPFGTHVVSDIGFTGRMSGNSSQVMSIDTSGKIGLMLFDGVAGQAVSIITNSNTFNLCNLLLIDPRGSQVFNMGCTGSGSFSGGQTLAYTGTYTIGIDPAGTVGSVSINLNEFTNVTGVLVPGVPTTVSTSYPGQSARYMFSGAAGQAISIAMTGETYPCHDMLLAIVKPDGTNLTSVDTCGDGPISNLILPATGSYTLLVTTGVSAGGGSATFTLTQNVTEPIPFNTALTVSNTLPGQSFDLTFNGTAGEAISLALTGLTYPCHGMGFAIVKPDGTNLTSVDACGAGALNNLILPTTGTYTLLVTTGVSAGGGSATFTLTQNITEPIPFNSASTVSSTLPGQSFDLTFSGTAGEAINLALTGLSYPCHGIGYAIVKPDGTNLTSVDVCGMGAANNLILPTTGTYTLLVTTQITPGSATWTLTQNITEPLTANTPLTVSSTLPGQSFDLTFSGTGGQVISIGVSGVTYPCHGMGYAIVKPDGTNLTSVDDCGNGTLSNQTLPTTGTYTLLVTTQITSGSATFTLIE